MLVVLFAAVSIGAPIAILSQDPPTQDCDIRKAEYARDAQAWIDASRCSGEESLEFRRCSNGIEVPRVSWLDYPRCTNIKEAAETVILIPLGAFILIFGTGLVIRWICRGFRAEPSA